MSAEADPAPVERWSRRLSTAGAALTGVALVIAALTGIVLCWQYLPDPAEVTSTYVADGRPVGRGPVHLHRLALVAAVSAGLWWTCLCALRAVAWRGPRTLVGLLAALGTLLLALTATLSWYLVRWDQLALWAVTTGSDLRGLWPAGFSDEVRFVLVGGAEVDTGTYARWLLVHLAAPLLALGTTAVGAWAGRAPRQRP